MAKKKKDDSEILEAIIAKSTNKDAIAAAQTELGALQQRKSSIAAAIQPALDIPQIVAQPTSKGVQLGSEDSVGYLKAIRSDMSQMLNESKKSRTLLEGILKTNQKYYESNSELINRLMLASGLSQEQLEALGRSKGTGTGSGVGATGGAGGKDGEERNTGGGGLMGLLGGGLAGLLGSKIFGKKTPTPDVDPKTKKPKAADVDSEKKPKGKGGRLAKMLGLAALLTGGLMGTDYLTNDDPDAWEKKLDDLVPDGLAEVAPDAALAIGLQAPTIANALRSSPPPPTPSVPDDKPPAKPAAPPPKSSSVPDDKPPAKPPAKPAPAPKSPPKGSSQAQEILNERLRGIKPEKEILEVTAEKVGKSTVKSALKKIPIVGLLAGLGLGGYRYLWEGDTVGAGLEVGAGAAAIVPGIGTVGSVGIDVASLVRDIYASVYGTFPEDDANVGERFDNLKSVVMKYLSDTFGSSTPEQQSPTSASPPPAEDTMGGVTMYNGGDDFAGAIAATTNSYAETDTTANPNRSRAQYLADTAANVKPIQKITPDKLNTIASPAGVGPGNVVINKQGDTINNISNGNAGGGGSSGVAGSPSKIPSPFDRILYGDTFNWGY